MALTINPKGDNSTALLRYTFYPMATYSITSTTQSGKFTLEATRDTDLPAIANDTGVELCIAIGSTGKVFLYSKPAGNSSLAVFNEEVDANGYKLDPGTYKQYGFRYPGMPGRCADCRDQGYWR